MQHGISQRTVACEVEVCEEHLSLAYEFILRLYGFLNLHYHLSFSIYVLDVSQDRGSSPLVLIIGKAAAFSSSMLYDHAVSVLY